MIVKGVRDRRCRCGKRPFYSEEAAAYALAEAKHRGQVNDRRRETRYYACEAMSGTWHLTSMTEAQRAKRARLWALCALDQWASTGSYTLRVRPGTRLPNPNLVRVIVKVRRCG